MFNLLLMILCKSRLIGVEPLSQNGMIIVKKSAKYNEFVYYAIKFVESGFTIILFSLINNCLVNIRILF